MTALEWLTLAVIVIASINLGLLIGVPWGRVIERNSKPPE